MKLIHFVAGAFLALFPMISQAAGFGPLIDAQTLETQRASAAVLIIDIRAGQSAKTGLSHFESGHIPNAVHAPYNLFRGPKDNPGALVTEAHLTDLFQGLGVTALRPVVIVHQGRNETDFGAAARVYWTLKSSGVQQLAILNGGMNAWTSAGLTIETGAGAAQEASDFTAVFSSEWLATASDITTALGDGRDIDLIDARPASFWQGNAKHSAATRPGTLPQSRYFVHNSWFNKDEPTLINQSIVPELAASNGFEQGDNIVSFCNTGHWAATNWFALSELAGIEGVKLYPESLVGWSARGGEMENVPGHLRHLWNMVSGKY